MGRVSTVASAIDHIKATLDSRIHCYDGIYGRNFLSDVVDVEVARALGKDPENRKLAVAHRLAQYGENVIKAMTPTMTDAARFRVWSRTKVIYAVDADLWTILDKMKPQSKVFTGMFRDLRHPNPFVLFPEPVFVDDPALGESERIKFVGMFIQGVIPVPGKPFEKGSLLRSTTGDDITAIALTFVGPIEGADGSPSIVGDEYWSGQDYAWHTVRVELSDQPTTLEAMTETAITRYRSYLNKSATDVSINYDVETHLPLLMRRAMGLLIYLCSSQSDLQERRTAAQRSTRKRDQAKAAGQPQLVEVGYRVGKAIRAHARAPQGSTSASEGDGTRTVSPHMRAPHTHLYWVGPGRREMRILPIGWVEVGYGKAEEADIGTVIPVKRPKGER